MVLCRRAVAPLLTAALVAGGLAAPAPAAFADHVTPRDTTGACPDDRDRSGEADYSDVAGTTFAEEIACVSDYRIALGTGAGAYSPGAPITRRQMALFLFRLALSAHLPLQAANNRFTDVDDLPQDVRDAINVIAHLGIAQGDGQGRFEPSATVTRGQMASFLSRFHGAATGTGGFPEGPESFDDDDGSAHEQAIDAAAAAGIAAGLGGEQDRLFAPDRALTRGQMAGFLARLLDLEVEAGAVGPRFVEPEGIEGTVVDASSLWDNWFGLDTDGDGAPDRQVFYDGNDRYLFGDREATVTEFSGSGQGLLTPGDRVSVSYLPNFYDGSVLTVVDDRVGPPALVLATAVPGADGVQDDVRVVWATTVSSAIVERYRSLPGADTLCGTADDPEPVADGTVEGPRERSGLLYEGNGDQTHPAVVDEDRDAGACHRYRVRSVSDEVAGSTPSEPSAFSNAVVVGGADDTSRPVLTSARRGPDGAAGEPRFVLVFGHEDRVVSTDFSLTLILACYVGFKQPVDVFVEPVAAAGGELTYEVVESSRSTDLSSCYVNLYSPAAVDEKGNPNEPSEFLPID